MVTLLHSNGSIEPKDENGNYAQNVVVGYTEGDIYLSASSDIEVDTVMRISCGKFLN